MDTNNKSASSAVHQEVNGAYRMVDMLTIIAYEKGVDSDMISNVIDSWKSNDKSASGAPQQLVNGLYRCVEFTCLIGNKSDSWGIWSSYFSSVYDSWVDINMSCQGAPQQAANGMYQFVEMLAGWAQTLWSERREHRDRTQETCLYVIVVDRIKGTNGTYLYVFVSLGFAERAGRIAEQFIPCNFLTGSKATE